MQENYIFANEMRFLIDRMSVDLQFLAYVFEMK